MILIGMLHHRKDPKTVIKSYAFAAVAKAEGADFFYFTPKEVDFKNRSINGQVYDNGKWIRKRMPFPDVVYNAGSPDKLAKSKDIIRKLELQIPFTTYSIGNKWNISERLKYAKKFSQYLIPTKVIKNTKQFLEFMNDYKKVVFKPIDGRKGIGILLITREVEGFSVASNAITKTYTNEQLEELIKEKLSTGTFIVQPYIRSVTKSGQVFDFRLHVQKNGKGKWVNTTIYPRVAPNGSIIPNINSGGFTNYLEPFLQQEFKEDSFNIKQTLEYFALALATHLDELQMIQYGEMIDEIGIDVGLDENQKLWIYEVNWRPGCPPTFYLELDVVINTIQYALFLAKNQKEIKRSILDVKKNYLGSKNNRPIIAITGSAGKTTSKAFLASILSTKWKVFESQNYWNTTEHTRKHLSEITMEHKAVVLEYGMAYPGVITTHCSIIQPNISVVTNVGMAHVGNFDGDIRKVAIAKSELIHGMNQKGVLFINNDDSNSIFLETEKFKGEIITIGIHTNADYRAYDITYTDGGMNFKVKLQNQESLFYIPILGKHHVYNALNAIAVADYLGFSAKDIKSGLLFEKPANRMTVNKCSENVTIIDDTVHSHPEGVRAALDVLMHVGEQRKIAIIGQMRELGELREKAYEEVGNTIVEKNIDVLITYGFRTEAIGNQAKKQGFPERNIYHFRDKEELHALLIKIIKDSDTILVKGASKTKMFDTVKFLKDHFS